MQPAEWWLLQAASLSALLACAALAYASAGRIGRHTPYGGFLFAIALGFWFLATGLVTYIVSVGVGAWRGPPGWGDVFQIAGWTMLVLAFYLLLWRFSHHRYNDNRRMVATMGIPVFVGLAAAGVAWYRVAGIGQVLDAEGAVRVTYMFLNGVMIAVFATSIGILRRLSRSSLATLFLYLGIALVIKTLGDLVFLVWPREPPIGAFATALYPLGGIVALVGLAVHHRTICGLPERPVHADPSLVPQQLILRDAATRMRDMAGALGEQLVLTTGRGALTTAGYPSRIEGGTLIASVPAEIWGIALGDVRNRLHLALGQAAALLFDEIAKAHGQSIPAEETL